MRICMEILPKFFKLIISKSSFRGLFVFCLVFPLKKKSSQFKFLWIMKIC